jgi:hypothetical protein
MLDCGTTADTQGCIHFGSNDHGQRCFAQSGRAGHQNVVGAAPTHLRRLEDKCQLFPDAMLAYEVMEVLGTEGGLNDPLFRFLSPADE